MRKNVCQTTVLAVVLVIALGILPLVAGALTTKLALDIITPGPKGTGGNADSVRPSISADGTLVAFASDASDLIPGLTIAGGGGGYGKTKSQLEAGIEPAQSRAYNPQNVYLYNALTDETILISKGTGGKGGNRDSNTPDISADGTRIVFLSQATDLIATTTEVSTNLNVYLYDIASGQTTLVTRGIDGHGQDHDTWLATISGDGSKIAFDSGATNLVEGVAGWDQIYLYDVATQTTELVTRGADGNGGNEQSNVPTISFDGTRIVFQSNASDLVDGLDVVAVHRNVFVYDAEADETMLITKGPDGHGCDMSLAEGRTASDISDDNNIVVFASAATNLMDGFTMDGNMNIFSYDIAADVTTLVTAGSSGAGGNNTSHGAQISGDGTTVGFLSFATNLIDGVTTLGWCDTFIYDRASSATSLVSAGPDGLGGNVQSNKPAISYDASAISFHSYATDLIAGLTTNGSRQVYLLGDVTRATVTFDAQNGTTPVTSAVRIGRTAPVPTQPTKVGYLFDGWWTAPTGGVLWDFKTPITADMTLYAHWVVDDTLPPTGDAFNLGDWLEDNWWLLALAALALAGALYWWWTNRDKDDDQAALVEVGPVAEDDDVAVVDEMKVEDRVIDDVDLDS